MGLIIDPAALVLVTMDVPEGALAVGLVVAPVSLIPCSILPDLFTLAVPILALPLPSVLGTVLEDELRSILNRLIVIVAGKERLADGASRLDIVRILLHHSPLLVLLHDGGR